MEFVDFYIWNKVKDEKATLTFKEDGEQKSFLNFSINGVSLINKEIDLNNEVQKTMIDNIMDMINPLQDIYYEFQNDKNNENFEKFKEQSEALINKINNI